MGFTVYYRSTSPVDADKADRIQKAIHEANKGRTWLSCEPVCVFGNQEDGHLLGGSKPNFMPHPDDVAAAQKENLPDGTIHDVVNILCDMSEAYGVDWEFSHDDDEGPVGFIRNGIADSQLLGKIEMFADLCDILGDLESGFAGDMFPPKPEHESENDEDDPPIIRLWPGDQ